MNSLLIAHVIVRTVCMAAIGFRGRRRVIGLLFVALALEAISRLFHGPSTGWGLQSMWSIQALVDIIVTATAAMVALRDHSIAERRRVKQALKLVHSAGVRMGHEQAVERLQRLVGQRGQSALDEIVSDLTALNDQQASTEHGSSANLRYTLATVARDLREAAGNSMQVRVEITEASDHIATDPQHLRQMLIRLGRNAIEAMPEFGLLTLRSRSTVVAIGAPPMTEIQVVDNGSGMSAAVIEHVMTPLFTTKDNATGLGLNVVKAFAESQGGHFRMDSTIGLGTTVTLTLPAIIEAAPVAPRPAPLQQIAV